MAGADDEQKHCLDDLRKWMEEQLAVLRPGKVMPAALRWILFGDEAVDTSIKSRFKIVNRKSMYKCMYLYVKYHCKIGGDCATMVFPDVLKMICRARLLGPISGHADPKGSHVHVVSLEELFQKCV